VSEYGLSRESLVCFVGEHRWARHTHSKNHTPKRLATENRVLSPEAISAGGKAPIAFGELVEVTSACLAIEDAISMDQPVRLAGFQRCTVESTSGTIWCRMILGQGPIGS
jgi:hypothetical protein